MKYSTKVNLLTFDRKIMREYFSTLLEKSYRADQTFQWIHQYGHDSFENMTNLSKQLRQVLTDCAEIVPPHLIQEQISSDGTRKWLFQLQDKNYIESVFIPEETRGTLCISSQVGCALNCAFCSTGKLGFTRNLSTAEIIGQLWQSVRRLSQQNQRHDHQITNVVLMGMGEPLQNFKQVVSALNIMMDDLAYGLSKYRVTLSTAGIVPMIKKLSTISEVSLAVSLHTPTNELRSKLMPINKKYPLEALIPACKNYFSKSPRRKVSFEYIMLHQINDQPKHAQALVKLLKGFPCKINLIPFNAPANLLKISDQNFYPSSQQTIDAFRNILLKAGINTIIRKTRGADIDAACGQLAGKNHE